jgi:hypothetical protein
MAKANSDADFDIAGLRRLQVGMDAPEKASGRAKAPDALTSASSLVD